MEITFNKHTRQVEAETSIQNIIDNWVGEKQKGIAVAVNNTVVSKTEWESYVLMSHDNVLVISATQGG